MAGPARRAGVIGIADGETLAGARQRVIIEAGRRIGIEARRQRLHLLRGEMGEQRAAAAVGGAAGEPHAQQPMAVNAVLRREDRPVGQQLQRQRRAEGGDGVADLCRAGRQERGAAVGRARRHARRRRQAEGLGGLAGDEPDRLPRRQRLGQQPNVEADLADPIRPARGDRVIAGLQCVIGVSDVAA